MAQLSDRLNRLPPRGKMRFHWALENLILILQTILRKLQRKPLTRIGRVIHPFLAMWT